MKKVIILLSLVCVYLFYKTFSMSIDIQLLQGQIEQSNPTQVIQEMADYTNALKAENDQIKVLLEAMVEDINEMKLEKRVSENDEKSRDILAYNFIEAYLNQDMDRLKTYLDEFDFDDNAIYKEDILLLNFLDIDSYRLNSHQTSGQGSYYSFMVFKHPPQGISNGFFINLYIEHKNGMQTITEIYTDI